MFASKKSLELIQAAREENCGTTSSLLLMDCFQGQWARFTETFPSYKKETELSCEEIRNTLWKLREPLSFESFTRKFTLNSTNHRRYPVINALLENEAILPFVKYIADILAWHSYLFSVLPSTTSRDQVSFILALFYFILICFVVFVWF